MPTFVWGLEETPVRSRELDECFSRLRAARNEAQRLERLAEFCRAMANFVEILFDGSPGKATEYITTHRIMRRTDTGSLSEV